MYVNGSSVASSAIGTFIPLTSYDLYVGYRPSGLYGQFSFTGLIDEISLYNRALTPNEIAEIYHAGAAGKCTANRLPPSIITQPQNLLLAPSWTSGTFSTLVQTTSALTYTLQSSVSLSGTNWNSVSLVIGTGAQVTLQDTNATPSHRFYRVRAQ
jgi:hypothetical protein